MTPEFKAKWIEALRGGKYQQARGVLKDANGCMCCLGVAADLLDPSKWDAEAVECGPEEERRMGFGWAGDGPTLCSAVSSALGISLDTTKELAERNDGNRNYDKHSFAEIAAVIETRL